MHKHRLFTATAAAGLVLGAAASGAHAETLELAATEVDAVVVTGAVDKGYTAARTSTATRTSTPLLDVPQAITVITGDLIQDQGMRSMVDVLRYVPGAGFSQGEGNRDNPILRGNATTADFFVDGVRDDVQYIRDLYNAERVEVLKGPNAMIFGRGGGGGVINRVTKRADFTSGGEAQIEGGAFDHRRIEGDVAGVHGQAWSGRLVGAYENSGSYRDGVDLERWGVNPSVAWRGETLSGVLAYEHFQDVRTADRGVPSYQGRPAPAAPEIFFGDPDISHVRADVDLVSASAQYKPSMRLVVRSRLLFGDYAKFYQNVFASGAATGSGPVPTSAPLQAYNNRNDRQNLFNQTDLVWQPTLAGMDHTVMTGFELGRQDSDNRRLTGLFGGTAATLIVPFADPTVATSVVFAPAATDADNHVRATVGAIFLQDQVDVSEHLQLIGGVRFDRFELNFHNHRNGQDLSRRDDLVSPRLGLVFKPRPAVSIYGGYSVSYLPSSGDQFSSLNSTTTTLEPEKFTNLEAGLKWDIASRLSFTGAVYRLDRGNTSAPDPAHAGFVVQTGEQRARGVELGLIGQVTDAWQVIGGYAWQKVEVTRTTSAAAAGQQLPLTPEHSFSLWNKVTLNARFAIGLGATRQTRSFAAIDNAVVLPGFTRLDAAVFVNFTDKVSAQLNVENLLDETYFATAQGNNNILPGSPRSVRVALRARF